MTIAGITTSPDMRWMAQMARNISLAEVGFLNGCRYLLHDRASDQAGTPTWRDAEADSSNALELRSPTTNVKIFREHRRMSLAFRPHSEVIANGEGYDDSRLDALFLTLPISWPVHLEVVGAERGLQAASGSGLSEALEQNGATGRSFVEAA